MSPAHRACPRLPDFVAPTLRLTVISEGWAMYCRSSSVFSSRFTWARESPDFSAIVSRAGKARPVAKFVKLFTTRHSLDG
jgi:hypothetical protein